MLRAAPFIKRIGELKFRHNCSLQLAELLLKEMTKNLDASEILQNLLTSDVVLDAASRGVFEIVDLCFKYFPELLWNNNLKKNCVKKLWRDGTCVSPDVSGAAFLLQRELQWFQAMHAGSPFTKWLKFQQHKKSLWEIFVEQWNELFKEAGQWMKDTSSSCSLVATLIITIAFAAAFTVPGGNNDSTGVPIFLNKASFIVFVVADGFALLSSVTATLMFLTILTSRYTIEDFLHSLPRKMVMGLTFLIFSLASMLVAFSSALTIILSERFKWIYIPITLLAAFPIVLFAILQLPLYIEMVESTFWPRLYRPLKVWK
ncbi:hypothetical protein EUGRSUZ_C03634 [Eucalyptus grandis]|uniref:Uncharacterized protein n=2 Tax=Eucalyptus grandis TaxID=71139 RepID=A0ACC3LIC2_EUCGR|nr:hypothetical protein EUGRSUZ_C03634 [Eucalyptus grandis]